MCCSYIAPLAATSIQTTRVWLAQDAHTKGCHDPEHHLQTHTHTKKKLLHYLFLQSRKNLMDHHLQQPNKPGLERVRLPRHTSRWRCRTSWTPCARGSPLSSTAEQHDRWFSVLRQTAGQQWHVQDSQDQDIKQNKPSFGQANIDSKNKYSNSLAWSACTRFYTPYQLDVKRII